MHSSVQLSGNVADNLAFQFLPHNNSIPPTLEEHNSKRLLKENFIFHVVELCPSEQCKKYAYMVKLNSNGLNPCVAMLTYICCNSSSNIHFVWKVPDHSSETFSRSLHTIEMVKEFVPVFHTQTMHHSVISMNLLSNLSHTVHFVS